MPFIIESWMVIILVTAPDSFFFTLAEPSSFSQIEAMEVLNKPLQNGELLPKEGSSPNQHIFRRKAVVQNAEPLVSPRYIGFGGPPKYRSTNYVQFIHTDSQLVFALNVVVCFILHHFAR